MKEQTLEKIGNSQFKEIYFLMMDIEHTGTSYLKALETITTINSILFTTRTDKEKEKEILDISIVNEIFSDVIKQIERINRSRSDANDNENRILVLSYKIAKTLLRKGYKMIDILHNKDNRQKTVFIFEKTIGIESDISELVADLKERNCVKENILNA